jgi:FkbM family methyltransferase
MVAKGQIAECMWRDTFEESERNFAEKKIKPGMRVLNIGANAGLYTIIASKLVGPNGIVQAFEPSSQNFMLLKKNIEQNGCDNVVASNLALSDFHGQLSLNRDPLHKKLDGHFYVRAITENTINLIAPMEIVSCATLDECWGDTCKGEIKPVDFIIIDVEGAEWSVFRGARQTIKASPNLVMIMECTEHITEIAAFLDELGFACYQFNLGALQFVPTINEQGSYVVVRGG